MMLRKEFLQGETVPTVLHAFKEQLEALDVFDVPSIKAAIKAVQKETGVKGKTCLCQFELLFLDKCMALN